MNSLLMRQVSHINRRCQSVFKLVYLNEHHGMKRVPEKQAT